MTRALFRVAAGPRLGFGHLRRAVSIARALGVEPHVSIRGDAAAQGAARRLGCHVVSGAAAQVLRRMHPDVLVLDDPNAPAALAWLRAARAHGARVASVHDLGIAWIPSDLLIDGSFSHEFRFQSDVRDGERTRLLLGPRYMPLDPDLAGTSRRGTAGQAPRVLIALGGGPRRGHALDIARAILRWQPDALIRIAGGFTAGPSADAAIDWLPALPTLRHELAATTMAVVAGGVTLYEACALGVPSVAVAVSTVSAQRHTVRAARSLDVTEDGGALGERETPARVALLVKGLVNGPKVREMLAKRGQRLVDGRGAERVARALAALARNEQQSVA